MARVSDDDPEEADDAPEYEGYEPEYHPEADDAGELWCPHCGSLMHGDASRCPSCGDYVTPGAKPAGRQPWWIWAGVALLVLAAIAMGLAVAR
jgi:hypothetical protein